MKPEIDNAIIETCLKIIKEPLIYFSESDVQQLLTEELRKIPALGRLHKTKVPRGLDSKGFYKTPLVHREYGGGGGTRIDVVVLDKNGVSKIENPNLIKNNGKYLKPLFAFELGTEKSTDTVAHFKNDYKKLKGAGTGYLIHFFKDVTQSASGTKIRNKTDNKIEDKFKKVFEDNTPSKDKNVKIIPILIRIARKQKKMWGKLEIYNGLQWNKVNINNNAAIKEEISNLLK